MGFTDESGTDDILLTANLDASLINLLSYVSTPDTTRAWAISDGIERHFVNSDAFTI